MSTEMKRKCGKLHSSLCDLANLIDNFESVSEEREKLLSSLWEIHEKNFGILGGDESWTVDQWHDYIRELIAEFQVIAREVL